MGIMPFVGSRSYRAAHHELTKRDIEAKKTLSATPPPPPVIPPRPPDPVRPPVVVSIPPLIDEPEIIPHQPTVRAIITAVCAHYETDPVDILSKRRPDSVVKARHIAMFLARKHTLKSLPDIGRRIGNKDHTTVIHAINKINKLLEVDLSVAADIAAIEAKIAGGSK